MTTDPQTQLAGILAAHVDHITAALRANASTGLPDDELGMERAAELLELHKRNLLADERPAGVRLLLDAMSSALGDAAVPSAPVDRAAVLAEAADAIEEAQHRRDDIVNDALGFLDNNTEQQHLAVHRAGRLLRRMADEEQQPETQAQVCGRTKSVAGTEYPPCARPAGHEEAYCRSADGKQYFLAVDAPAVVPQPGKEA